MTLCQRSLAQTLAREMLLEHSTFQRRQHGERSGRLAVPLAAFQNIRRRRIARQVCDGRIEIHHAALQALQFKNAATGEAIKSARDIGGKRPLFWVKALMDTWPRIQVKIVDEIARVTRRYGVAATGERRQHPPENALVDP